MSRRADSKSRDKPITHTPAEHKHSGLAAVQINSSETGKHRMTEGSHQGQDSKVTGQTTYTFCLLRSKHLGDVADHMSSSETGIALRMSTWSRKGCQESRNKPPTPSAKQTDHISSSETGMLCIAEGCQQGQDAKWWDKPHTPSAEHILALLHTASVPLKQALQGQIQSMLVEQVRHPHLLLSKHLDHVADHTDSSETGKHDGCQQGQMQTSGSYHPATITVLIMSCGMTHCANKFFSTKLTVWNREKPKALVQNQQTREVIRSAN